MGRDRTKIDDYALLFQDFSVMGETLSLFLYVYIFKLVFNASVGFVYNHINWSDSLLQHNIKVLYSISSTIWVVLTGLKM